MLVLFVGLYALECFAWVPKKGLSLQRYSLGPVRLRTGPSLYPRDLWSAGYVIPLKVPGDPWALPTREEEKRAAARVEELELSLRWLHFSSALLVLIAFCLGLWFYWAFGPKRPRLGLILVAEFLFLHLLNLFFLFRAQRRLKPKGRAWPLLLLCGVSPWANARAADLLSKQALEGDEALATAPLWAPKDQAAFLQPRLLALSYPLPGQSVDTERLNAWKAWAEHLGQDPHILLARPEASSPQSLAYCPYCRTDFSRALPQCPDCGRGLLPF